MTMRKTWEADEAGVGAGVAFVGPGLEVGLGLGFAGAVATGLGPQAASRQTEMTTATDRTLTDSDRTIRI
jgi:hypothetical protein